MTNPNYSHITLVVDRSGSMASMRDKANKGINEFIKGQAEAPGSCTLTLVEFDTEYSIVQEFTKLGPSYPVYNLIPRGGTALLDAMGRAATTTGAKLAGLRPKDRPANVYFVVMTDGEENSSREWTKERVVSLLDQQRTVYNWQVLYLGANQDAIGVGSQYNFDASQSLTTNTRSYDQALGIVSGAVLQSRSTNTAVSYSSSDRSLANA